MAASCGAGRAKLSGRAVARIFHKLASPAYKREEWHKNRYWGGRRRLRRAPARLGWRQPQAHECREIAFGDLDELLISVGRF